MAKVKDHFLGNMSQHEIDVYLYNKQFRDMEYEEWMNGEGYVAFVNEQMMDFKPTYSKADISDAIMYGVNSIILPAHEIGDELYGKLLQEKVFEYLNSTK